VIRSLRSRAPAQLRGPALDIRPVKW
jgi:hypothetical protein